MTASTDPALPPPRPAAGSSPTSPSGPRARSSRPNAEATDSPTRAALEVAHLDVATGGLGLVHDVTFSLHRGDRVGLIGESGSGKSLTALAIMGLLPDGLTASGAVRVPSSRSVGVDEGGDAAADASAAAGGAPVDAAAVTDVVDARESVVADLRGRVMSMVFQEPMTALNPLMRVGRQVAEVMVVHQLASRREAKRRALELLGQVQLRDPAGVAHRYPHQLSGGQRQRVMLAIALANDPDVLICDEPTTALDVTVQAQMLDLIVRGAAERDAALLFITHDLAVVATVCDRVMVMYGGHIVESGSTQRVFMAPRHPYTRGLVMASDLGPVGPAARGTTTVAEAVAGPQARIGRDGDLPTIPGSVPAAGQFPSGCVFRTRCERADDACRVQPPWDGAHDDGWACVHPYAGSASETEGRKP